MDKKIWMRSLIAALCGVACVLAYSAFQISGNTLYNASLVVCEIGVSLVFVYFYEDIVKTLFYSGLLIAGWLCFKLWYAGSSEYALSPILAVVVAAYLFFRKKTFIRHPSLSDRQPLIMNGEKREYTLLIDESEVTSDGVIVKGYADGEFKEGDSIMVVRGDDSFQRGIIKKIQETSEKNDHRYCTLLLTHIKKPIETYDVLTSTVPSHISRSVLWTPILRCYLEAYNTLHNDSRFMAMIEYALLHNEFLSLAFLQVDFEQGSAGFGFKFFQTGEGINALGIFTDHKTIQGYFEEERTEGKKLLPITMIDAIKIVLMNQQITGVVINPRGPKYLFLHRDVLQKICLSERFHLEFGNIEDAPFSFEGKKGLWK